MTVGITIVVVACAAAGVIRWRFGWAWALTFAATVGVLQNALLTWTQLESMRWLDDAIVGLLSALALVETLRNRRDRIWLLVPVGLVLIVAIQAFRSPTLDSGILQARQLVAPIFLIAIGLFMRNKIDRKVIYRAAALLALVVSVYMLFEVSTRSVIVSPVYSYLSESTGRTPDSLRNGLPPAYTSDLTEDIEWFRSGGPFFNAPISGIFVATGIYAAMRTDLKWLRFVTTILGIAAIIASIARAGLLLAIGVSVIYLSWLYLGKIATIAIGMVGAVSAWLIFAPQGATASHSAGLFNGFLIALARPLGDGLGVHGYFASSEETGSAESLLGLLFAGIGILAVLLTLVVAAGASAYLWVTPRSSALPGLFLIGVLGICAFSESVTSLRGSVFLWAFTGIALSEVMIVLRDHLRQRRALTQLG